jgi:hypothetical protein
MHNIKFGILEGQMVDIADLEPDIALAAGFLPGHVQDIPGGIHSDYLAGRHPRRQVGSDRARTAADIQDACRVRQPRQQVRG